ncbi:condensin-2 complex subunit D3 [Uranotaenia lowii]|uniref:condensin-2 complex subunit D3 n=1 Tax=Uranotaenia lowii TaxID=190385 RepID=UPI002479AAF2|nr:condensin-2 complex subunit D3 [Uranotaenia lowii]XP_055613752.1 condensin-2 complex subunit D3 [Uranotaenia lowii]
MAPPHVHLLLDLLPKYFDPWLTFDRIEAICNGEEVAAPANWSEQNEDCDESDPDSDSSSSGEPSSKKRNVDPVKMDLRDCPSIRGAINDSGLIELMHDICMEARKVRQMAGVFDQYDNWQYLSKKIEVQQMLALIYGLVCLAEYDPTETVNRKLATAAVKTYLILLGIPGQKQTEVFDEQVLIKCLDVFKLVELLMDPIFEDYLKKERSDYDYRLLMEYIQIMDEIQLLLKCMTLKGCSSVKLQLINGLKTVLNYAIQHTANRHVAENVTDKVFETLDAICLPEHDDHNKCSNTIQLIFNRMAMFYKLDYKNLPACFQIYNFFLKLLDQYPSDTPPVLTLFIKSVLTNPPKVFSRPDDYAYLSDVAVRYETAMYSRCNVSIVDYLKQIEGHADTTARVNIVDFLGKLACLDCTVDWELFKDNLSEVPREILMIEILYNKLIEKNSTVKLKAFHCLLKILQNGNQIMKKIMKDTFFCATAEEDEKNYLQMNDMEELYRTAELELGISRNALNFNLTSSKGPKERSESTEQPSVPQNHKITSNIKGIERIEEKLRSLLDVIYSATLSTTSSIRRIALSCLECIVELNRNRIDDPVFEYVVVKLAKDPVMLMRRTTLNVLNTLLARYPSYLPLIKIWSKCLLLFLDDSDQKLKETALESLKVNVFDNICRFEDSSSSKVFTPWMIVRSILVLGKISVLKSAVDSWIQKSILTQKNLMIIESHIVTVNCSEAWIILSIIAGKMKSKNPDVVIKTMNEILQDDVYNSPVCLQYILCVIKAWLDDFTRAGLNHLFKILSDLLRTGSTTISLVSDVYSLCCAIKEKSDDSVDEAWIRDIRKNTGDYLLHYRSHYTSFHMSSERYLISLLAYVEACTDLNDRPDETIMSTMLDYLAHVASDEKLITLQTDQNRKICVTIVVLSRFGLRDGSLASTIIADFGKILKFKNIHESIICTLITSFSDLCKRHTSLVDSSIKTVILQLNSSYVTVRSVALNNLNELILQDYVKMRGRVLLNILKLIIDEDSQIAAQALYVIQLYVHSKNEKLLKVSMLECVYVFNNYLQYAESDMFPASEIDTEPCDLAGSDPESLRKRNLIYDFFVDNIDDLSLLKLLKNINKINTQLKQQKYVECEAGADTLLDLLYIFTKMVMVKDRDKARLAKAATSTNEEEVPGPSMTPMEEGPSPAKKSRAKMALQQSEQETITIVEKAVAIYYDFEGQVRNYIARVHPTMVELTKQRLQELALALARQFRSIVEFAKPMDFWRGLIQTLDAGKSVKPSPRKGTGKRRRKTTGGKECDSESEESDPNDADNDDIDDEIDEL